ncbi:MAG: trimethylamine methyltransferase [Dehalococcoidales bacterium]|nr:trimethylamine methyltransferase [Dehalococcoidales bacterium]
MKLENSGYAILSEEQVQLIHKQTLELLERLGVWIWSEEGLDLLGSAGCDVKDPKRVKIPNKLVMDAIEKAPKKIDVYDRDGRLAMTLETDSVYFGTGSDCVNTIDLETGERRSCTKQDIARLTRFCDALPNIDFLMSFGVAGDSPEISRFVHQYEAMLLNSSKPCLVPGSNRQDVRTVIDMAAAAVGGLDVVRERPPLIIYPAPLPPLTHPEVEIDKCLASAEYGVPFTYVEYSMLGATAPVTMAGALTQANADVLTGLVITQLKYPGAKFIYGGACPTLDMKYGTCVYGSPEVNMSAAALTDMSRFYKLPCFSLGGITDSKILDAQAGLEYAFSIYIAALSGASLIHDCGFLDCGLVSSFESVLMADEVISMAKHYLKPLEINEKTIALDVIDQVGPGGTYLTHPHTTTNFRQSLWHSRFLFRAQYSLWEEQGCKDMRTRLNEAARKIFAEHPAPTLPESVVKTIDNMVKKHS